MSHSDRGRWLILIFLSVVLCYLLHDVASSIPQDNFYRLFADMSLAFGCMTGIVWLKPNDTQVYVIVGIGIFLRWLLVWYPPLLSDDLYRFLWDGNLWHDGINPFSATPSTLMDQMILSDWYISTYDQLNSQDYFTIYPPICQLVFWLSTIDGLPFWMWGTLMLKSIFFISECVTIFAIIKLCRHLGVQLYQALMYVLNPLICIELIGNIHFESLMVSFLALMLLFMAKRKIFLSGLCYGLAICTKILPLMFGPFLLVYFGWKKGIKFFGIAGIVVIVSFVLMLQGHLSEIMTSINLYFQTFEFNASLYYIGRSIGQYFKGYNIIKSLGPSLSILGLLGILWMSYNRMKLSRQFTPQQFDQTFILTLMGIFTIYLLTATTVHPWYLSTLILLSVFTKFRYAVVWSWTVLLSYSAYLVDPTTEILWLVAVEYVIVIGCFFWELYRRDRCFDSIKVNH